jgi:lysophospholipase L1-like esterase
MKLSRIIIFGTSLVLLAARGLAQTPLFEKGACILFQGDSITDGGRGRTADPNHVFGQDYAYLIAARQGADFPERNVTFINRGISGNTVSNLTARWQADTLDLKPDVLSILIGVNDVGHKLHTNQIFSVEEYEQTYDKLLADTIAVMPRVKLILGEPFMAPGKSTADRLAEWQVALKSEREVVEKLGKKYHAPVVHYQKMFDAAFRRMPAEYWIWDGVHPTYAGHQLMADEWQRTYKAFYGSPADKH